MRRPIIALNLAFAIAAGAAFLAPQPADAQRILYGAETKYKTTYGGAQTRGGSIHETSRGEVRGAKKKVLRRNP